jgi:hypothetical protein
MRVPLAAIATLACVAIVLQMEPAAGVRSARSRVFDRTFACPAPVHAGLRQVEVSAISGFRDPENRPHWKWRATATIAPKSSLSDSVNAYAWLTAGDFIPREYAVRALVIDPRTCVSTTRRVPFSTKGLVGGVASQLQGNTHVGTDAYDCPVSKRIMLRVRATFRRPTEFVVQRRFDRRMLTTKTAVVLREAQLAVRSTTGKPITYASVSESGRARLFTAPSCVAD